LVGAAAAFALATVYEVIGSLRVRGEQSTD
jgi:hypothetical protein